MPRKRPACHTTEWPIAVRAPQFFDQGRACGNALSVPLWMTALEHTPTCKGCTRALRGLLLAAGDDTNRQRNAFALTGVPAFRFDLSKEPSE